MNEETTEQFFTRRDEYQAETPKYPRSEQDLRIEAYRMGLQIFTKSRQKFSDKDPIPEVTKYANEAIKWITGGTNAKA